MSRIGWVGRITSRVGYVRIRSIYHHPTTSCRLMSSATKTVHEWHTFKSAPSTSSGLPAHIDVPDTFTSRQIQQILESKEYVEGKGARVRRSLGRRELKNLDPFLLFDEFEVAPDAGFPDHPHRGFETVTYVLKGAMEHQDFAGNHGTIGPGDLQWMTAGRGIIHTEMAASTEITHGLQFWVNLSAKDKMMEPRYQDLRSQHIPRVTSAGVNAIVIAGQALGITSPIYTRTPTHYIHFKLQSNTTLKQPIPVGWNSFLYILSGHCYVGNDNASSTVSPHYIITLDRNGDGVTVCTKGEAVEFVLLAGKPNDESIVQSGLFVMNTRDEITQTKHDYQSYTNGFERAKGWKSQHAKQAATAETSH